MGALDREVLLHSRKLGSDAVYRLLREDIGEGTVLVEVITAPGLPAGLQMRISADAAAAMLAEEKPASGRFWRRGSTARA
ncbi:MAG: hypothetical protein JWM31_114 [Solirubrobacterales bacterium]|nr:hypothetical protein [Solirubrobacterales bacterium]